MVIVGYYGNPNTVQDTYSQNSYVLDLAVANTPCFGEYEPTDGTCLSCPIQGSCIRLRYSHFSKATLLLDQQDAAQMATAKHTLSVQTQMSVDDILSHEIQKTELGDLFSDLGATAPLPAPKQATNMASPSHIMINASQDTGCQVCKKTIQRGSKAVFLQGVGFKHPGC